jgi:hypothetical protein
MDQIPNLDAQRYDARFVSFNGHHRDDAAGR